MKTSSSDASAHAHTQGVLHRDLKPSNILIKWTLMKDGRTVQTRQTEARFNSQRTVQFDDEHFIRLDRRSLHRTSRKNQSVK